MPASSNGGARGRISHLQDTQMEHNRIGESTVSIDDFYDQFGDDQYERDSRLFLEDEGPADTGISDSPTFDDPNNFNFTFSEDDLLPTQWSNTQYDYSPFPAYGLDHNIEENIYSRPEAESKDRRITIQRAFVVSEPNTYANDTPESSSEAFTREENTSHRLSRTISSLRRKTKSASPHSQGANEVENAIPVAPSKILQSSAEVGQRAASSRGRLRGRTRENVVQKDTATDNETIRSNISKGDGDQESVRTKSRDGKKRRSFRWEAKQHPSNAGPELPVGQLPVVPVENGAAPVERPRTAGRSKRPPELPTTTAGTNTAISTGRQLSPRKLESFPTFVKNLKIPARPATKAKDEMWSIFRSLESECEKLQSKQVGSKAGAVELTLLPFLRNYGSDKSCENLHPENLEKRCTILAKWWAILLHLAEEWDNEKLSFRERFTIIEGALGILQRPEWRQVPDFSPRTRSNRSSEDGSHSNLSDGDAFLVQSVHHNIRNLFIEHLQWQLSFVIGRLSQRDPSGALANLGGITCAYAIFFCSGIAGPIMKLWKLPNYEIQRIWDSTDGPIGEASDVFVSSFPSGLRSLKFVSIRDLRIELEKSPNIPTGFKATEWTNQHWIDKWCGRKGDLFCNFIKHYHILLSEFVPASTTQAEIIRAPTLIMIRTQMLIVTRSSVHRADDKKTNGDANPAEFDDVDSNVPTLPLAPDAARSLTGRRYLALLRENLTDRITPLSTTARTLLAQGAKSALKATVRQTSLYDHSACFNLCDFAEDALVTITAFERENVAGADEDCDPLFWTDVLGRMLQSSNTLTVMRVFSFIFTIWPKVAIDQSWKQRLCHDLLLRRDVFYTHFNHWCPLVRLYYFRLLAWRIARFDGSSNQNDVHTLQLLHSRIQEVWSHYKKLAEEAQKRGSLAPSTAPCNPVPGRRLLIIRTEVPSSPSSRSFNSSPSPSPRPSRRQGTGAQEESSFSPSQLLAKLSSSLDERRKGSFLQTFSNRLAVAPAAQSRDGQLRDTADEQDESTGSARAASNASSSRESLYEQRPPLSRLANSPAARRAQSAERNPKRTQAFFKFSLEAVDRRPLADMQLRPPRLPLAAQLLLQSQAGFIDDAPIREIPKEDLQIARYAGRALAEWTLTVNETQNFFERRRREGVTANKYVETPTLGVEAFKRLN